MPDEACANNLNLDDIPQDLKEFSTMERRHICENDGVNNVADNVTLHQNSINATHNCNMTTDDSELLEDQITLEWKENLTGHVLPSMLQFENLENAIFQCVPGQNNIPRYILLDDEFEVLAFADLFPLG